MSQLNVNVLSEPLHPGLVGPLIVLSIFMASGVTPCSSPSSVAEGLCRVLLNFALCRCNPALGQRPAVKAQTVTAPLCAALLPAPLPP